MDMTPGTLARLQSEIAVRLADWLIRAGRKDPDYRTDADTAEWRNGAAYLHGGLSSRRPLWWENPARFLDGLYEHIVSSERWPDIHHPGDVYDRLDEILAYIAETEHAAAEAAAAAARRPSDHQILPRCGPEYADLVAERMRQYGLEAERNAASRDVANPASSQAMGSADEILAAGMLAGDDGSMSSDRTVVGARVPTLDRTGEDERRARREADMAEPETSIMMTRSPCAVRIRDRRGLPKPCVESDAEFAERVLRMLTEETEHVPAPVAKVEGDE